MFNLNKTLLSILVLSGLTVQTTQPITLGELPSRMYEETYKQSAQLCSRLSQSKAYKQCAPYGNRLLDKAKRNKKTIALSAIFVASLMLFGPSLSREVKQISHDAKQGWFFYMNNKLDYELNNLSTKLLIRNCNPNLESHLSNIELLVCLGADPNITEMIDGRTTLHFAVLWEEIPTVRFLLKYGADKHKSDFYRNSPYSLANTKTYLDPDKKAELLNLLAD